MTSGRSEAPLRLCLDGSALAANWRWMNEMSGTARCGAAVKADAYGLGASEVVPRLAKAGCRDFFVARWDACTALGALPTDCTLSVLHGVREEDMPVAINGAARPVLNTLAQLARWRETGKPCDVMVDTGMNRLGLSVSDVLSGALNGVDVITLMSHLACADEDVDTNSRQRDAFAAMAGRTSARSLSLANSAGVFLGRGYAFDLTRPGLALYGGVPRREGEGCLRQVAVPQAQVLQVRSIDQGETVGYGAAWTAKHRSDIAILNIGYADGYCRALSNVGSCMNGRAPVVGRVSMDLLAVDVTGGEVGEGDWLDVDFDLLTIAEATDLSQYEVLTGLSYRLSRRWK